LQLACLLSREKRIKSGVAAGVGCFGSRKDELRFLLLRWRKSQMDDAAADAWSCDGKSEEGNKEKSSHQCYAKQPKRVV
jgi:hypothetical protein